MKGDAMAHREGHNIAYFNGTFIFSGGTVVNRILVPSILVIFVLLTIYINVCYREDKKFYSKFPNYFKRFIRTHDLRHLFEDYARFHTKSIDAARKSRNLIKSKYVVYRPALRRDGFLLSLNGMLSALLYSMLSGRIMFVQWPAVASNGMNCDSSSLQDLFKLIGDMNWNFDDFFGQMELGDFGRTIVDDINWTPYRFSMTENDEQNPFPLEHLEFLKCTKDFGVKHQESQLISIQSDQYFVSLLLQNPYYEPYLLNWFSPTKSIQPKNDIFPLESSNQLDNVQFFSMALRHILILSESTKNKVLHLRKQLFGDHFVVGIHIRLQELLYSDERRHPDNIYKKRQRRRRMSVESVVIEERKSHDILESFKSTLWSLFDCVKMILQNHDRNSAGRNPGKVAIFADSGDAIDLAKLIFGNTTVVHSFLYHPSSQGRITILESWMQIFLFSYCQELVITEHSPAGMMSAALSGRPPVEFQFMNNKESHLDSPKCVRLPTAEPKFHFSDISTNLDIC